MSRIAIIALLASVVLSPLLAACDSTPQLSGTSKPLDPASVSAQMAAAMSSLDSLSGTATTRRGDDGVVVGTLTCDAAGNYSQLWDEEPGVAVESAEEIAEVYNAQSHALVLTYREPGGGLASIKWQDAWPFEDPMGQPGGGSAIALGAAWRVRAALEEGDPSYAAELTTFDGRDAWRVTHRPGDGVKGETIVIDRQTGCPVAREVQLSEAEGGGRLSLSLTELRVDESVPAEVFSAKLPRDARLVDVTRASYFCDLGEVAGRIGFGPFVPSRAVVPHGFRLSEVATDGRSPVELVGGWSEPIGQDEHRTQFLRYRDGFNSFSIQIASMRGTPHREMMSSLKTLRSVDLQRRRLVGGPFAGRSARTWFDDNGANLLVFDHSFAALITGALTRSQSYSLAEALVER